MSVLYSQILHFIWSGTLLKNTDIDSGESLALSRFCPQKVLLAGCQPGPGFPAVPCLGCHRAAARAGESPQRAGTAGHFCAQVLGAVFPCLHTCLPAYSNPLMLSTFVGKLVVFLFPGDSSNMYIHLSV